MSGDQELTMDQAFLTALKGEDNLGIVMRAHIHIESSVIEYINAVIPHPDRLPSLRYQQRIDLACALGLGEEYAGPLKILGELRNAFAHRLTSGLTAQVVAKLRDSLSPYDRDAVETVYKSTNSKVLGNEGVPFSTIDAKSQFILIAITLKAMLMVAVKKARTARAA